MTPSILVAYATNSGSTLEVAQAVAETLRSHGLESEVLPAGKVRALSGYAAVVLGAPLYMSRWLADARHFLSRFGGRGPLASLPVAIFALGPFHNKAEELQSARQQLDKQLAKYSWLKPVAVEVFAGKFDPGKLSFPYNLILPLKKMPPSDERDWEAIHAWSERIADVLKEKARL